MNQSFWIKLYARVLNAEETGFFLRVLGVILWIMAQGYGLIIRFRRRLYDQRIFRQNKVECCVISIGNITVGGTGKTPMTILLARELQQFGLRVAVISRGYKRAEPNRPMVLVADYAGLRASVAQAGDEPFLIAQSVPGIVVAAGKNRSAIARHLVKNYQPQVILLDDGFSHLKLHRDFDILLVDASQPFGNGHLLPRGQLREPTTALKKADLVIFTRSQEPTNRHRLEVNCPVLHFAYDLDGLTTLANPEKPVSCTRAAPVIALAGIANPENFLVSVRQNGFSVSELIAFDDHAHYNWFDLKPIFERANNIILTTEKDRVKLQDIVPEPWQSQILVVKMKCRLISDRTPWFHFLRSVRHSATGDSTKFFSER